MEDCDRSLSSSLDTSRLLGWVGGESPRPRKNWGAGIHQDGGRQRWWLSGTAWSFLSRTCICRSVCTQRGAGRTHRGRSPTTGCPVGCPHTPEGPPSRSVRRKKREEREGWGWVGGWQLDGAGVWGCMCVGGPGQGCGEAGMLAGEREVGGKELEVRGQRWLEVGSRI